MGNKSEKLKRNGPWSGGHIKTRSDNIQAHRDFTNVHVRTFSTWLVIFEILNKTNALFCPTHLYNRK